AIEWVPLVNSVLEEMPTLSMRVIENGRIAIVRRDDQRVTGRRLLQFESEISQPGRRRPVKSLHAEVRGNRKRSREQNCTQREKSARNLQPRSDPFAGAASKDGRDRDERKLIPLMAVPISDKENEQRHRGEPPMKEPRIFSRWQRRSEEHTSEL